MADNDPCVLADACWTVATVANTTKGDDERAVLVELGVCALCVRLLDHAAQDVLVPALRGLGFIVMSTSTCYTDAVLRCDGVLSKIAKLTGAGNRRGVRQDAWWTLSNIAAGNDEHIDALLGNDDVLNALTRALAKEDDVRILREAIFVVCNAADFGASEQTRSASCSAS